MYRIRKNIVIGFEITLMVVQLWNLRWMMRFFPSNYVEWGINFLIFLYVFYEMFIDYLYWRARG